MKIPPALRLAYIGFAALGIAVVAAYLWQPGLSRLTKLDAATPASPASDQTVPQRQPEFTLSDLDGKRRPISEWAGHPKIVNFWATWCVPCRKEIPLLNRIQAQYQQTGLKIIGIAVDFADDVRKFNSQTPLGYDVLVGEDDAMEAAKAYGVGEMALPFTAFVDSHGEVLTVHLGELHEAELQTILGVLLDMDAGKISAEQARDVLKAKDPR